MISTNSYRGIRSAISGLKIMVKGKCSIIIGHTSTIELEKATIIMGTSLADELTLICNDTRYINVSTLNIKIFVLFCSYLLYCYGKYHFFDWAWVQWFWKKSHVEDVKITITGNNREPSFGNIAVLRLKGSVISKPERAKFDIDTECVVEIVDGKKQTVKGDTVIEPMSIVAVTGGTVRPLRLC